jgi:type II secretory pathway component PulC
MINKIRNLLKNIKNKKSQNIEEIEDNTGEFLIDDQVNTPDVTATNIEASEDFLDIDDKDFSFTEKASLIFRTLKDKIKRLNKRNFKSPSLPGNETVIKKKKNFPVSIKTPSFISTQNLVKLDSYILGDNYRNKQHKIFQVSIAFLLIFTVAKTTALFLKGNKSYKSNDIKAIHIDETNLLTTKMIQETMNLNIFKTGIKEVKGPLKPVIAQDKKCDKAKRRSNLSIKLLNTIVLQNSRKSLASIQAKGDVVEYREGEKIDNIAKIGRINRLEIIVKNLRTGACESIINEELKDATPLPIAVLSPRESTNYRNATSKLAGIKNEGNSFIIEKSFMKEKIKDIGSIVNQAKGIQITNPDGTISFKIVEIEPGSVYTHLGIKNNDIINSINGKKISSLNEVMSLFGKLGKVDKLNLGIARGGNNQALDYKFK